MAVITWDRPDRLNAWDLETMSSIADRIEGFQRLTRAVLASPLPCLAAIDGVCVGGALEFTASCDARIFTSRSRFLTPEVRIGFVMSNAGSFFLPHVLGESAARELLLTGAEKDAGWMDAHGFGTVVNDLDAGVDAWIASFAPTSRTAVAATKRLLNDRWGDLLAAAMERESYWCVELFDSPDAQAALRGFPER